MNDMQALISSIVTAWYTISLTCGKGAYNYWAVLAFEIFLFIFWLASFALMAVTAAAVFLIGHYWDDDDYSWEDYYEDDYYGYTSDELSDAANTYGAILAAAAGIGALNL